MKEHVRELLYSKIDITQEFNDLLGADRSATRRKCWNKGGHKNGDQNPSLSFDPKTGAWRCFSCQEKGDLFTLYHKVRGLDFPKAILELATKYRITELIQSMDSKRYAKNQQLNDEHVRTNVRQAVYQWASHPEHLAFMQTRYGLTRETLSRWSVGYDTKAKRLSIPIWKHRSLRKHQWDGVPDERLAEIVNVRKHDVFRTFAQWRNTETGFIWPDGARPPDVTFEGIAKQQTGVWSPFWSDKSGKTLSERGYGKCYLYPFEMIDAPFIYLVGGELKALLLIQLGLPALTFTTGEGGYDEALIPLFVGKRVRVVMDVDEAGVNATKSLSRVLADSGAYVQMGVWREDIVAHMPSKGDITDYLQACDWNPEALEYLEWVDVQPTVATEDSYLAASARKIIGEPDRTWDQMSQIRFSDLINPRHLRDWVRVPAMVSGRGDTPFSVPRRLDITCEEGRLRFKQKCAECPLYRHGFTYSTAYTTAAQLELVGLPSEQLERKIATNVGIPKGCPHPQFEEVSTAVDVVMLTPTVDLDQNAQYTDIAKFEYRHQPSFVLDEDKIKLEDNHSYEFGGRIMPDPKNGKFTFAIRVVRPLEDDILDPEQDHPKFGRLQKLLGTEPAEVTVPKLLACLRDHHLHIFNQDRMLLTILLSMHLPFTFHIGQFYCERLCPSVLILGDTTVGKSTATQRLISLYGAGRYANIEADPTFAGLIGGNLQQGQNRMSFSWGLFPTSHRAFLALDEYNKLPLETIGKLTNTLSSGIAERITANGTRRTLSWVRLLELANPRGERSLKSFVNPMDAALGVAGTTQDLGRIDYVHIQHQLTNTKLLFKAHKPEGENWYNRDIARAHIAWAWSKKPRDYVFEDDQYVLSAAERVSDKYGHHTLCIPAQFRFKLARFAAGIATICASGTPKQVHIRNSDVDFAEQFFTTGYAPYLDAYQEQNNELLSKKLLKYLDELASPHYKKLKLFVMFDRWSEQDLREVLGDNHRGFIEEAYWERGYIRKEAGYFKLSNKGFAVMIGEYLAQRERRETETSTQEQWYGHRT